MDEVKSKWSISEEKFSDLFLANFLSCMAAILFIILVIGLIASISSGSSEPIAQNIETKIISRDVECAYISSEKSVAIDCWKISENAQRDTESEN